MRPRKKYRTYRTYIVLHCFLSHAADPSPASDHIVGDVEEEMTELPDFDGLWTVKSQKGGGASAEMI